MLLLYTPQSIASITVTMKHFKSIMIRVEMCRNSALGSDEYLMGIT